jgi:hypothetical protein
MVFDMQSSLPAVPVTRRSAYAPVGGGTVLGMVVCGPTGVKNTGPLTKNQ